MATTTVYQAFNKTDFQLDPMSALNIGTIISAQQKAHGVPAGQMTCPGIGGQGVISHSSSPFVFALLQ